MEQIPFGTDDFAENPEPRVPCVLALDVSSSMAGEPIAQLNEGLQVYRTELLQDKLAKKRVETAIVSFGQDVTTVCDFTTAENFQPPTLETSGMTPMGKAIHLSIDMVEDRKQTYKSNGIAYYRPWIMLLTDGAPNDAGWEAAAQRAKTQDQAKAFALFAIGVGEANFDVLRLFTARQPLKLKGLQFRELFVWLSKSLRSVSKSTPGENVPLENPTAPDGWASIG